MQTTNHQTIIENLAPELKEIAVAPEWAGFVKTGHGRQRPPIRNDWWQVRSAAILLSVQKLGPVGVSKLRIKYGNRKNRGVQPEKFVRASGNILRKILQQLESAKLIQKAEKGAHKGRIITKEGARLIIEASKKAQKTEKKE